MERGREGGRVEGRTEGRSKVGRERYGRESKVKRSKAANNFYKFLNSLDDCIVILLLYIVITRPHQLCCILNRV